MDDNDNVFNKSKSTLGPAFPSAYTKGTFYCDELVKGSEISETFFDNDNITFPGMSYRQWLLGKIVQGFLAGGKTGTFVVGDAFELADSIIEKLLKEKNQL